MQLVYYFLLLLIFYDANAQKARQGSSVIINKASNFKIYNGKVYIAKGDTIWVNVTITKPPKTKIYLTKATYSIDTAGIYENRYTISPIDGSRSFDLNVVFNFDKQFMVINKIGLNYWEFGEGVANATGMSYEINSSATSLYIKGKILDASDITIIVKSKEKLIPRIYGVDGKTID